METKICIFNDIPITFALSKDNGMMINATEMGKVFGETVEHFTRLDGTKKFITACLNNPHLGNLGIEKEFLPLICIANGINY